MPGSMGVIMPDSMGVIVSDDVAVIVLDVGRSMETPIRWIRFFFVEVYAAVFPKKSS